MRAFHRLTWVLALGGTLPACDRGIALSDYSHELNRRRCQQRAHCGDIGASEIARCATPAGAAPYSLEEAVGAARVGYDGVAAREWLQATAAASESCEQSPWMWGPWPQAPQVPQKPIFTGLVPLGGDCLGDGECERGAHCDRGQVAGGQAFGVAASYFGSGGCPGTCKPWPVVTDASCTPCGTSCCGSGSTCDADTQACRLPIAGEPCQFNCGAGFVCDGKTCQEFVGAGSACHSWECRAGLYCVLPAPPPSDVPGTCQPPGRVGEACGGTVLLGGGASILVGLSVSPYPATGTCDAALYCDVSRPDPVCALQLPDGSDCSAPHACRDDHPCIGLAFSMDWQRPTLVRSGRCAPFSDLGGRCVPDAAITGCPSDMRCDFGTATCEPRVIVGRDCSALGHGACDGGAFCHPATLRCTARDAYGEACVPPDDPLSTDPCQIGRCDPATRTCSLECPAPAPESPSPFAPAIVNRTDLSAQRMVAADFDGDGQVDLAVIGQSASAARPALTILLGNGDGSLRPSPAGPIFTETGYVLEKGDFDGDGHVDLVTSRTDGVLFLFGVGDGTFRGSELPCVGCGVAGRLVAAHFNRDGMEDLVATLGQNSGFQTFVSDRVFGPQPGARTEISFFPSDFVVDDFDGDFHSDVVTIESRPAPVAGTIRIFVGAADGSLTESPTVYPTHLTRAFAGNFDRSVDRVPDLLGLVEPTPFSAARIELRSGNGGGEFFDPSYTSVDLSTVIAYGDVDGDGHPDLLGAQYLGGGLSVVYSDVGAGFPFRRGPAVTTAWFGTALVADFDRDGRPDVAAARSDESSVEVFLAK